MSWRRWMAIALLLMGGAGCFTAEVSGLVDIDDEAPGDGPERTTTATVSARWDDARWDASSWQ
ncbi:MAG: hypothetical protein RIT81_47215 [Deltaproteobacteria bacterium]